MLRPRLPGARTHVARSDARVDRLPAHAGHSGQSDGPAYSRGQEPRFARSVRADTPVKPLFAAADATPEETLARYPDGSAAIAVRHVADGISLFVGPPGLTSELLRLAARKSGVHLVTQCDCNVYANGPYLVLHASQSGPLEIDTGAAGTIRDLMSGEMIGSGPTINLVLQKGDTRVLVVGKE